METKRSWTRRFDSWAQRNPVVWLVRRVSVVVSVVAILVGAGYVVHGWLNDEFRWRDHEYEKLAALHSDFTLARFVEQLGAPVFQRQSPNQKWTEYLFRGRDYWVQAISRIGSQTVGFYAVTACSREFGPEFRLPDGEVVALQRSTLASLRHEAFEYMYTSGASTRPSFIEFTGGSHAVNFKHFGWGFNGACSGALPLAGGDFAMLSDFLGGKRGGIGDLSEDVLELGRDITVNTFAEWGPTEGFFAAGGWPAGMSVGIDEIMIGAAENQPAWRISVPEPSTP